MRRIFALLLVTPLLANCSDSVTPMAPSGPLLSTGDAPTEEAWLTDENWFTQGDVLQLVEEEGSVQAVGAPGAPTSAVMVFGNPDVGTAYLPGQHDQSLHARDRINPG